MELRDYQAASISSLFSWWHNRGNTPTVCVLPTAAGKTIIFSTLIKQLKESWSDTRILILAHTQELVEQAETKLLSVYPNADVGVYSAGLKRRDTTQSIISASRDSIANNLDAFQPFDIIIIDEAHLINNKSEGRYRSIIDHFTDVNHKCAIVGFTATPYRAGSCGGFIYGDGRLFAGIAHDVKMIDLIRQGYLCPITAKSSDQQGAIDTSGIKSGNGDFVIAQLSEIASKKALVMAAVNDWKGKAYDNGRKSSAFFAVSVAHAELIKECIDELGIDCSMITGETDKDDRAAILAKFEAGNLPAIINIATLTTGWDAPCLDCIVLLRPTKSLGLYMQIVGRGLRLHPDKENTLLLDYGGNLERFGPIDQATPPQRGKAALKTQDCPHCEEVVSAYAFTCPCCTGKLKDVPRKQCDHCGTECAPATTKCPSCGSLFLTHHGCSVGGAILSLEDDIRRHIVERISAVPLRSKKTNKQYVGIRFWVSMETYYQKNLFLDWAGRPGRDARELWDWLFPHSSGKQPQSTGHASQIINKCPAKMMRVESVDIDHRSKYNDVIRINPASNLQNNNRS